MALEASARLPLARGRLISAISTEFVISNSGANAPVMICLIYGLISQQISLDLLGARGGNGFRGFIETVCAPLLAPFKCLMLSVSSGGFQLRLSYVFALVAYLLLHTAIHGLLRLLASRKTAI